MSRYCHSDGCGAALLFSQLFILKLAFISQRQLGGTHSRRGREIDRKRDRKEER
jgi:hypothetical protein